MVVDVRDPSTWRFLTGKDDMHASPAENAQALIGAGANGAYDIIYADSFGSTVPVYPPYNQTTFAVAYANELRNRGCLHHLQAMFWHNPAFLDVVRNINNTQDDFIASMSESIVGLQPDIVQLMNEPIGEQYTTAYMSDYVAFCNRSMATYAALPRPLKSEPLTFTVNSVPFWDMTQIADQNFVVPSGCTLVFAFHHYYDWFGNGYIDIAVPPDNYYPESIAYWNNKNDWADDSGELLTSSERAVAKELMKSEIFNKRGLQSLIDNDRLIFWEESGGCLSNPNIGAWIDDCYEWAVQRGWGFNSLNYHLPILETTGVGRNKHYVTAYACTKEEYSNQADCEANGGEWYSYVPSRLQPYWNTRPGSIFEEDWSLNIMGEMFKKYTTGGGGAVSLPYSNPLNSLTNLSAINGSWAVQ